MWSNNDKFDEVKKLFKIWLQRMITPLGRVAILKSLILSKLIHLWILLPNPPDHFVNDLQKECFRFVWNGKQDRISRKSTIKDIRNGGLNVPDIKNYMIALKLTWIRKLNATNQKMNFFWTELYPFLDRLECYGPRFLSLNVKGNSFWTDTFKAYIFFSRIKPNSIIEVLSEPVFYNENIKIGNKVIKHTKWIENGV